MSKHLGWMTLVAQLGLAAAWLMTSAVYVVTPKPMAQALAMTDWIRQTLGVAVGAMALLVVVGTIGRGNAIVRAGVAALAVSGILWSAYDFTRHWPMFAGFHAALAVLAIAILFVSNRTR